MFLTPCSPCLNGGCWITFFHSYLPYEGFASLLPSGLEMIQDYSKKPSWEREGVYTSTLHRVIGWEEFRSQEKPFLSRRTRHWKCLLSKHENLSLDPRTLIKVWAWRCPPVINPSPREAEPGGSLGHKDIISYLVGFRFSKIPYLKHWSGKRRRKTPSIHSGSPHMYTCVSTPTHTHEHIHMHTLHYTLTSLTVKHTESSR